MNRFIYGLSLLSAFLVLLMLIIISVIIDIRYGNINKNCAGILVDCN